MCTITQISLGLAEKKRPEEEKSIQNQQHSTNTIQLFAIAFDGNEFAFDFYNFYFDSLDIRF